MRIPGLTTTRLHLLLAVLGAATHSLAGGLLVLMVCVVTAARWWSRHLLHAEPGMAVTEVGTGVPSIPSMSPGGQPA